MPVTTRAQLKSMDSTMDENAFFDALDEVFGTDDGYVHHLERIKKMKEENEKLKKQCLNEARKMKKENEKWTHWASEVIHWSHSSSLDNLQAKKLITDDNQPTIASVRDFGKEISQLNKENCELKYKVFCYDIRVAETRVLKEEIEKLKEENELWRKQQPAYQEQTTLNEYKKTAEEEIKKLKKENEELSATAELIDDIQMAQQKREEEWQHDYKVAEMRKEKIEEVMGENEKLKKDILEMGAEINNRCADKLLFHQTPDGENCLIIVQ